MVGDETRDLVLRLARENPVGGNGASGRAAWARRASVGHLYRHDPSPGGYQAGAAPGTDTGASSFTRRLQASWPATSSRWRRCCSDVLLAVLHRALEQASTPRRGDWKPDDAWVTQQARNVAADLREVGAAPRFLVHDRDTNFTRSFNTVFQAEGARIIDAPIRAPNANAHADGWVGSVPSECLDWTLVRDRRHLEAVLRTYIGPMPTGPIEPSGFVLLLARGTDRTLQLTEASASDGARFSAGSSTSTASLWTSRATRTARSPGSSSSA